MNDYYTTIAASNLGFVRPLQPRIPSLHEPPVPGSDSVEQESVVGFESNVMQAGGVASSVETPQPAADSRNQSKETEAEIMQRGELRESAATVQTEKDERGAQPATAPTHSLPRTSDAQTILDEPRRTRAFLRQESIASETIQIQEVGSTPIVPDAPIRSESQPVPSTKRNDPVLTTNGIESLTPKSVPAFPSPSKSSEPTIHVTIGRIEVTAVTRAPVAKKPKSAPVVSRLSLEEYLKRGRERQR